MNVIVKGMKMPRMCSECDFCGGLIWPAMVYACACPLDPINSINITKAIEEDCRHPNCPFVEVPTPHGRLIDADYLKEHIIACVTNGRPLHNMELSELLEAIDDVPTVIEAEK